MNNTEQTPIPVPTKFTQEIKDNWLANLRSGKYKQGFRQLHSDVDGSYCCLGVLGVCTPGLTNAFNEVGPPDPYEFFTDTIGSMLMVNIYKKNDEKEGISSYARDYSNVIPLIEALPVQD